MLGAVMVCYVLPSWWSGGRCDHGDNDVDEDGQDDEDEDDEDDND